MNLFKNRRERRKNERTYQLKEKKAALQVEPRVTRYKPVQLSIIRILGTSTEANTKFTLKTLFDEVSACTQIKKLNENNEETPGIRRTHFSGCFGHDRSLRLSVCLQDNNPRPYDRMRRFGNMW